MTSRKLALSIAALIVVAVGWYAFRPERLFVNQRVDEPMPAEASAMTGETGGAMTGETGGAMMGETGGAMSAASEPQTLATGSFHTNAHKTQGMAAIYRRPDGSRLLRFSNFETSNGPDVHVYLVAAPDVQDNGTVTSAGYVDLGTIKGNIGDQNYALPASVDLAKFRTVTIWCKRFHVNFGSAPLVTANS